MAQQFKDQGGAATSNPSPIYRFLSSKMMRRVSDPNRREKARARFEQQRRKRGEAHRVEYFHQVEDPYSHLAAQVLQRLIDTYEIELVSHLVSGPTGNNHPEPELLETYGRYDCSQVAPHYGLEFPNGIGAASDKRIRLAGRILALAEPVSFPQLAVTVGRALWSKDPGELIGLEDHLGAATGEELDLQLEKGNARQAELGHYSGAMFYYGGEWYWGVDRLYHLENRLKSLSARRHESRQLVIPRPGIERGTLKDKGSMTLEFYPSLRSPYSSIIFDKTIELANTTRVKLVLKPVLPMVMRGVSVTREKGAYIMMDTAREGETLGLEWGNVRDPIGDPVRNAFSLYAWAREQNKAAEFLSSFLRASFFNGVNTNSRRGLQRVVELAGLSWDGARSIVGNTDWEEEIEQNRLDMYEFGCWGVPSFRLLDADGNVLLRLWGQDRLWLVARVIQARLRAQKEGG